MAADHPTVVERGLRLKKAGNRLMEVVGGRSIHPVNVRIGGFYRFPTARSCARSGPTCERALEDALETVRLVAGFEFPDIEQPYEYLALRTEAGYPIEAGSVVTTAGGRFAVRDFADPHRGGARPALQRAALQGSTVACAAPYAVGPLARYTLNADRLSPLAREAAASAGLGDDLPQPVPLHHRARGRAGRSLPRGAADHRRLDRRRRRERAGAAPGRGGLRRQRGAARSAVPPLRARRRRHHPGRPDRAADLAEPGQRRGRPARPWSAPGRTSTSTRCSTAASTRSATTTRASPAPPTSST